MGYGVYLTSPMSDTTGKYENLLHLGLSPIESQVYIYLAESSPTTALALSRLLAVPRTSIYDALSRLSEKRLIERVVRAKSTYFKASPTSQFEPLIIAEKEKINSMMSALKSLESQLKPRIDEIKSTEVRYYQGAEGMRQMIWNCLKAEKEEMGYSVFGRVEVVGLPFYKKFVEEFSRRKLNNRVIINPTERTLGFIHRDVRPNLHHLSVQNIRSIPSDKLYIAGDTMIYNNTYAVSYWQGHEVVGVEIENPDFVKHELSIFELLWKLAKPITQKKVI